MTFLTIAKTSPSIGYNNPGNVHFPIISSTNRYAFAYDGASKYVTGGVSGQIYYSTDGSSWVGSRLYPTTGNEVRCIIWDGNRFVAAAGGIWTSTDGIDWFNRNTTGFYSIAYNGTTYVAYAGTTIQSSTDCITWTTRYTSGRGGNNGVVKWTGTSFIVGDGTSGLVFRSTDGITWATTNEGLDKTLIAPTDGNSYKVYGSFTYGRNSTNGLDWNNCNQYTASGAEEAIWDTDNSRYVMVGGNYAMTSTDGYTYTNRSALITNQGTNATFYGLAKNPTGNFVAVGSVDTKLYSTDGISWVSNNATRLYPSNASNITTSLTAGNGAYVMGRNAATLLRSTDGIAWTEIGTPFGLTAYNWRCEYGDKFVAVSYGSNKVMNSTDGITWNSPNPLTSVANWIVPTWNGSVYTTVAYGTTSAAYSTNGVTWTASTLPAAANWSDSASLGSTMLFIANGSAITQRSTDGITWTQGAMPVSRAWQGLASNGTYFVAVATSTAVCARSTDGVTWTEYAMPASSTWQKIAWDGTKFYVATSAGSIVASSTDGITWVTQPLSASDGTHIAILNGDIVISSTSANIAWKAKANTQSFVTTGAAPINYTVQYNTNINKFLCYGTSRLVQESTDGNTWTYDNLSYLRQLRYSNMAYGGNTLVSVSGMVHSQTLASTNICVFSKDEGQTWGESYFTQTVPRQAVAYGAGKFVTVLAGSVAVSPATIAIAEYSTDGVRWQSTTMPSSLVWSDVVWTGSQFFAVGFGASRGTTTSAARSTDGITWTAATMPSQAWNSITYGNGIYVANYINSGPDNITLRNTVSRSTDGITWTTSTLPLAGFWGKAKYVGSYFVSIANGLVRAGRDYTQEGSGYYTYSTDGITWVQKTFPTAGYFGEIAYNGSVYCVVKGSHHNVDIRKTAYISTDLITWTAVTLPTEARWYSITNIGTKFVAIADNDYVCATSTDGVTWVLTTSKLPTTMYRSFQDGSNTWVAGSLGMILSTSDNQTYSRYIYDYATNFRSISKTNLGIMFGAASGLIGKIEDGRIWTPFVTRSTSIAPGQKSQLGNIGGITLYTAAGGGAGVEGEHLFVRKNNWFTLVEVPSSGYYSNPVYSNGKHYLVGTVTNNRVVSSTDGYNWIVEKNNGDVSIALSISYFKNLFIGIGVTGSVSSRIYASTDGITWVIKGIVDNTSHLSAQNADKLVILDTRFRTLAFTSTDGNTWGQYGITNIGQSNIYWHTTTSNFVVFGTTAAYRSTDGVTWVLSTNVYPSKQSDVILLENDTFVVFATVNRVLNKYTSTDGITWSLPVQCDTNLTSYIYHDGQSYYTYTNSGAVDTLYASKNGINWKKVKVLTSTILDIKQTGSYITAIDNSFAGSPGNIVTTTDEISWTLAHAPSDSYHGVSSNGAGEVVAVGNSYIIKSTNDGVTWSYTTTPITPTVPSYSNLSINYVDNNYTICHAGSNSPNIIFRSTDLSNWSIISYNRIYNNATTSYMPVIRDFTTLNGKTVMLAEVAFYTLYSNVFTSTDGNTWYSPPLTKNFLMDGGAPSCCTNDGTKFLVVNQNKYAYTSTDGYTWTESNIMPVTPGGGNTQYANTWPIIDVTWTGTYFVTVLGQGYYTQTATSYYNISTDGITWTERSTLPSLAWREVFMFKGNVVALAYNSSSYATSTNALTWTTRTLPRVVYPTSAYNDNILVVFDYLAGTKSSILTSTDGISWTQRSVPVYDFNGYGKVIWNGSEFLAKGARKSNGYVDILKSTDGITWTYSEVYFANSTFGTVLVNNKYVTQTGFELTQSTDGINWVSDPGKTSYFYTKAGSDYFRGASLGAVYKNSSLTTPNLNVTLNSITYG